MSDVVRITDEHIAELAEIERLSFSDPWSENSLRLLTSPLGVGFAVMCEGAAVAYAGMMCVLDEAQIVSVATHPAHRRKGYAAAVLDALCEYARQNGLREITLEVRRSGRVAFDLYSSRGFVAFDERKNYYKHPTEDAILMKKFLGEDKDICTFSE